MDQGSESHASGSPDRRRSPRSPSVDLMETLVVRVHRLEGRVRTTESGIESTFDMLREVREMVLSLRGRVLVQESNICSIAQAIAEIRSQLQQLLPSDPNAPPTP